MTHTSVRWDRLLEAGVGKTPPPGEGKRNKKALANTFGGQNASELEALRQDSRRRSGAARDAWRARCSDARQSVAKASGRGHRRRACGASSSSTDTVEDAGCEAQCALCHTLRARDFSADILWQGQDYAHVQRGASLHCQVLMHDIQRGALAAPVPRSAFDSAWPAERDELHIPCVCACSQWLRPGVWAAMRSQLSTGTLSCPRA